MEKSLQKKTNGSLAYLETDDTEELGTEGMDRSDLIIPRIKIVQPVSAKAKESGLKEGSLYNSLNKQDYGNLSSFIFLFFWKSKVWFDDSQKFLGTIYTDSFTKQQIEFGNDIGFCKENMDAAKDSFNYFVVLEKDLIEAIKQKQMILPMIFSCSSSSIKYGRQLNTEFSLSSAKKIPMYGQVVEITTHLEKFNAGSAWMPQFKISRYVNKVEFVYLKELYPRCKELQGRANPVATQDQEETPYREMNGEDTMNGEDASAF